MSSYRRKHRGEGSNAFDEREPISVHEVDQASYGGALEDDLKAISRQRAVRGPIRITDIVVDPRIQVRVGGVDPEVVETYTNILLEGGSFAEPVVVFNDDENHFYLADGFHRIEAYKHAFTIATNEPEREVDPAQFLVADAEMRHGSFGDAFEFAEESNLKHGLRLNNKDKRNILERRISRGHAWASLSSNAVARELGVSDKTVTAWRSEITKEETTSENSEVREKRTGRDGREYNVSKIQKSRAASAMTAQQKIAKRLVANLRAVAEDSRKLGYPESTATEFEKNAADVAAQWEIE